jgi:hypothetical protein
VDEVAAFLILHFEMRNIEPSHRVQRRGQRLIGRPASPHVLAQLPQDANDTRAIETLALAVLAEIRHGSILPFSPLSVPSASSLHAIFTSVRQQIGEPEGSPYDTIGEPEGSPYENYRTM